VRETLCVSPGCKPNYVCPRRRAAARGDAVPNR
jgi:hypothetical protein